MTSCKNPASLLSINVPRKQSPVKNDYIIHRLSIVGPEFSLFTFGEADEYNTLSWKCIYMDEAFNTYFLGRDKIFVINCYEFQIYS